MLGLALGSLIVWYFQQTGVKEHESKRFDRCRTEYIQEYERHIGTY